jgi:hypothetical protein
VRAQTDERVAAVAKGIFAAIVKEASESDLAGPFSLDNILRAWLKHDAETVAKLPDPPGSTGSSSSQRRTYWFYEGCQVLEEGARIAEVGDGKFAIASLKVLSNHTPDPQAANETEPDTGD